MKPKSIWSLIMAIGLCAETFSLTVFAAEEEAPAATQKLKPKKFKKKGYDYEASKYKALMGSGSHAYRFDTDGNPIIPVAEKPARKKSKMAPRREPAKPEMPEAQRTPEPKPQSAVRKPPETPSAQDAVYACPMGDYRGSLTQDGRCPKCGMTLQKQ